MQERIEVFVHNAARMARHVPEDDKLDKNTYGLDSIKLYFKGIVFYKSTYAFSWLIQEYFSEGLLILYVYYVKIFLLINEKGGKMSR